MRAFIYGTCIGAIVGLVLGAMLQNAWLEPILEDSFAGWESCIERLDETNQLLDNILHPEELVDTII